MSIETVLTAYLNSTAGKRKVEEARKEALKAGKPFGQPGGTVISSASVAKATQAMKDILVSALLENNLGAIGYDDIVVSAPRFIDNGEVEIDINFVASALRRESLDPVRFPDGVDNIIRLISHGWDTHDGRVSGFWHGEYTWNKTVSQPNGFLQQAVSDFNKLNLGRAKLNDEYLV